MFSVKLLVVDNLLKVILFFSGQVKQEECMQQELPVFPSDQPSAAKFLSKGYEIKIVALEMDSPIRWWVRIVNEEQSRQLSKLQDTMNEHYSKLKEKRDYT